MKKIIILFSLLLLINYTFAQNAPKEPDFVGEAFILKANGEIFELEKETVQFKTKVGVSVFLVGIGKMKTKIQIDNCCSGAVYSPDNEIQIVVKAINNETDPLSIIKIFKFKQKKKKRLAELSSVGTFSGGSSNNLNYLKFRGKKYGEKSYLLTIKKYERGSEYGIIVSNPDALDQRSTIVSTFRIE